MQIDAGSLDRRITFEARVESQGGPYNRKSVVWAPHATVWAQVRDLLPGRAEYVEQGLAMQRRPCRIRLRWRGDITGDMRIDYGGRKLRIIAGPVELGRRVGLELTAEEYSSEGLAP